MYADLINYAKNTRKINQILRQVDFVKVHFFLLRCAWCFRLIWDKNTEYPILEYYWCTQTTCKYSTVPNAKTTRDRGLNICWKLLVKQSNKRVNNTFRGLKILLKTMNALNPNLSSLLWCPLGFPHINDVHFVFTCSCL